MDAIDNKQPIVCPVVSKCPKALCWFVVFAPVCHVLRDQKVLRGVATFGECVEDCPLMSRRLEILQVGCLSFSNSPTGFHAVPFVSLHGNGSTAVVNESYAHPMEVAPPCQYVCADDVATALRIPTNSKYTCSIYQEA